jgi:hypothetical protein
MFRSGKGRAVRWIIAETAYGRSADRDRTDEACWVAPSVSIDVTEIAPGPMDQRP